MTESRHTAYMRKWYANRIQKMHEALGGFCVKCGATEGLEIDHIDPQTKIASVSTMWNKPWPVIQVELDKCQLLCTAHHLEKSRAEGSQIKNRTYGEDNGSSKLTWDLVKKIRQMYAEGLSIKYEIVPFTNVSRYTVMRVVQNKSWEDNDYRWEPRSKNVTRGRGF